MKIGLWCDSALPLLGIYPKEIKSLHQRVSVLSCLLQHFHSENDLSVIDRKMEKEKVIYYIYHIHIYNLTICIIMNGPRGPCAKWNRDE